MARLILLTAVHRDIPELIRWSRMVGVAEGLDDPVLQKGRFEFSKLPDTLAISERFVSVDTPIMSCIKSRMFILLSDASLVWPCLPNIYEYIE
jgi:hypothetical protein